MYFIRVGNCRVGCAYGIFNNYHDIVNLDIINGFITGCQRRFSRASAVDPPLEGPPKDTQVAATGQVPLQSAVGLLPFHVL